MKKKYFAVLTATALAGTLLAGCSSSSEGLKDGTYRAEMKEASHGYTDYVEITVKSGKIDTVVYDSVDGDGKKKSQDEDYKKSMMDGNKNAGLPETYPADYMKKLGDSLIEKQDTDQVDAVAGATTSSNDFKKLVSALKTNMEKGKTDTVIVDNSK